MSARPTVAVGIDLGTTYSVLATMNPSGRAEIVPNPDSERLTASAVCFPRGGAPIVGQVALEMQRTSPSRVVTEAKRDMGVPDTRWSVDGKELSPIDISAMILREVVRGGERVLGPIRKAVITVPAYFDEVRRAATIAAAQAAGLEVLRILNEPTAAALAYGVSGKVTGTALVYDFGGGTFDVSIVRITSAREITVVASDGDNRLGGKELDRALAAELIKRHATARGRATVPLPGEEAVVLLEAERVKKLLSKLPSASAQVTQGGITEVIAVERADYERLIKPNLAHTELLVDEVLRAAGLAPQEIDHILLVGGSSRTPAVHRMLRAKFGKDPMMAINPDEVVALGAAIQASILLLQQGEQAVEGAAGAALARTRVRDVTPHSYGTTALDTSSGRPQLKVSTILPKNSPIPARRTETYYTVFPGQERIKCDVTQGEATEAEYANVIFEALLDLPPGRPAGQEVRVTYAFDENGMLACEFVDVASGRSKVTRLDMAATGAAPVQVPEAATTVADDDYDFDDVVVE